MVIALPFVSALVLPAIASWRVAIWVNAGASGVQFLAACALLASGRVIAAPLIVLISFVALSGAAFGLRDIPTCLAAGILNRRRVAVYHAGFQVLVGALQAALIAHDVVLVWLAMAVALAATAAMTGAALGEAAATAAARVVLHGSIGLVLALLGTLLLDPVPDLAVLFLVFGYVAVAGLVPWHAWLPGVAAEGMPAGATLLAGLLPNAPLLLFQRLHLASALLVAIGLTVLLICALGLLARLDWRRTLVLSGMAQLGMVMVALGLGAPVIAWLHVAVLALVRGAVLQTQGNDPYAWLALGLVPLCALYLLAGVAIWLLLPLAVGALLIAWAPLQHRPAAAPIDWRMSAPVWLQLALALLLIGATPGPVVGWLRGMAVG